MKPGKDKPVSRLLFAVFVVLCVLSFSAAQLMAEVALYTELTAQEKEYIEKAMPRKAAVAPEKPRKLLVVNLRRRKGKVEKGHASIPHGNYALKRMGEVTGAYEAVFSNDFSMFKPENIIQFDAICFSNSWGNLFDDTQLRNSLLDFVYSGKGIVAIHGGLNTFVEWPEYGYWPEFGKMLGATENGGHPWKPDETITLKLEGADHPLNAAFNGLGFDISDEVYQLQEPYFRDRLRVLTSIDTEKTDMSPDRRILPQRRKDKDFPVSWVRDYGSGRVFYTALGHNKAIYWNAPVLRQLLDGIQFAAGDLRAPSTPSGKLTPAARAREKLNWRLAVQCWSFNRFSFYEAIDKVEKLGLRHLECYIFGPGTGQRLTAHNERALLSYRMPERLRRDVRRKLLDADIRLINCYIGAWPQNEAGCRKIFEFAREMGIETFVSEPDPDALDLLEQLCDEYNINLAIHNHPQGGSRYWHPREVLKVCEGRSSRIGACADTGHWMRSGIDPVDGLKMLEGRIISLHLKDLNELGNPDAHDVPWGTGKADIKAILAELARQNFQGTFSIEYEHNWDNSMPQIAQCINFFDEAVVELAK